MRINSNNSSAQNAHFGKRRYDEAKVKSYQVMSDHAFAHMGINRVAYITHHSQNNDASFTIYAADGHLLGEAESLESAQSFVLGHGLLPLRRH